MAVAVYRKIHYLLFQMAVGLQVISVKIRDALKNSVFEECILLFLYITQGPKYTVQRSEHQFCARLRWHEMSEETWCDLTKAIGVVF